MPESCFRFFRVAFTKRAPPEVIDGRNVVWIQMQQRLEGFRGAGSITRTVLRHCQQISGTALRREQFDSFAQRRYGSGVFLLVEKHHSQVEISFGHFWIDSDGSYVFGACLVRFLERCVDVRELKMRVSKFWLFGDNLLQRLNRRFKIALVDVPLSLIQKVIERVRYFLRLRLDGRLGIGGVVA